MGNVQITREPKGNYRRRIIHNEPLRYDEEEETKDLYYVSGYLDVKDALREMAILDRLGNTTPIPQG